VWGLGPPDDTAGDREAGRTTVSRIGCLVHRWLQHTSRCTTVLSCEFPLPLVRERRSPGSLMAGDVVTEDLVLGFNPPPEIIAGLDG
jgi:hypothetical protein